MSLFLYLYVYELIGVIERDENRGYLKKKILLEETPTVGPLIFVSKYVCTYAHMHVHNTYIYPKTYTYMYIYVNVYMY